MVLIFSKDSSKSSHLLSMADLLVEMTAASGPDLQQKQSSHLLAMAHLLVEMTAASGPDLQQRQQ